MTAIHEQSPDIGQGVTTPRGRTESTTTTSRQAGRRRPGHDVRLRLQRDRRAHAAADPARPQALASAWPRCARPRSPYLRPDGKTQVTVGYEDDKPVESSRSCSPRSTTRRRPAEIIHPDLIEHVVEPIMPEASTTTKLEDITVINPTGKFVIGGPMGDTGLTGRKIIVDTYGGVARTAAAPSRARTRPRSTAPAPTRPATSPRTSSPPASPSAARSRSPTPSASPTRCP